MQNKSKTKSIGHSDLLWKHDTPSSIDLFIYQDQIIRTKFWKDGKSPAIICMTSYLLRTCRAWIYCKYARPTEAEIKKREE